MGETLEGAVATALSLREKLPGAGADLVEELVQSGCADVTSHAQRHVLEALFARSRVLAQNQGREPRDGKSVFESLPLSKEYILLKVPDSGDECNVGAKRMYAEI